MDNHASPASRSHSHSPVARSGDGAAASGEEILHASRGVTAVKCPDGTFRIRWRWFRGRRLLRTLFYFIPVLLLIDPTWRTVNVFTVFFVVLALIGLYLLATLVLNSTWVEADHQFVRVAHGPLPWPGRKQVAVKDIAQLYVGWTVFKQPRTGRLDYTFTLTAQLTHGDNTVLVGGPLDSARAKMLEVLLEKELGITNRPVKAEWRGM